MKKIISIIFISLISFNSLLFSQFIENKGQVLDWAENFHPEVHYFSLLTDKNIKKN